MEQRLVEEGLTVTFDGVACRQLGPGCRPLTFGRAKESPTHLHIGPSSPPEDRHISSKAGSVRWRSGLWTVRNESETWPFDVVVGSGVFALAPHAVRLPHVWAIGPDGVVVRLRTPIGRYEIGLRPVGMDTETDSEFPATGGGSTTPPPMDDPNPTAHERLLLAAKFLSRRNPGDAIGDELAAARATVARGGATITAKAVGNCVWRWKEKLEQSGRDDLRGRSNIDRTGCCLLIFGVLRQEDRLELPPVDDDV